MMFSGGNSDVNTLSTQFGIPADVMKMAEGFGDDELMVYPDNEQIYRIFGDMITQWRVGAAGAIGLVYEALPTVFRIRRVKRADEEDVFNCLQIMERAALEKMRDKS